MWVAKPRSLQPMTPTSYGLKRRIGVVPQDVAVFDELTVAENVNAFCALYVRDRARRRALVDEAIEFVDLGDYVRFRPKKLSGGLLRRLNIACGIAHKPELIFFDEPTVAVDPQSRNAILSGIQGLRDEKAAGTASGRDYVTPLVEMLLDERLKARAAKDWAASDRIRDGLTAAGIRVKDRKDGTDWELE